MKKTSRFFAALLTLASTQSFATVIGFETSYTGTNPALSSYSEAGYTFAPVEHHVKRALAEMQLPPVLRQINAPHQCSNDVGRCAISLTGQYLAYQGASFIDNYGSSLIEMDIADGKQFTLVSVDLAELFTLRGKTGLDFLNAEYISIHGTKLNNDVVQTVFILDNIKGSYIHDFQTFFLPHNFTNLKSVSFSSGGAGFAIDNIVTASPVPEPSTVVLFLVGITSLMYFRKKSTKA